jgi:chromosome segregation ATPase
MGTPESASSDNHAALLLRQQLNAEKTQLSVDTRRAESLRREITTLESEITERQTKIDQYTSALEALGETTDAPPAT